MTTIGRALRAAAAACLIASCGGGGGSSSPPPMSKVSGTVAGTTGAGLVLQLTSNGTSPETKAIGADGPFSFTALVTAGAIFNVIATSLPSNQTCAVVNGGGSMPGVAVTNVTVTCSTLAGFTIAGAAGTNPLVSQQWHLKNDGTQTGFSDTTGVAGADIHVDPAFGLGYTGSGVTVAVVDSGLEILHEDLAANVVPGGSWNFKAGVPDPTDPTNTVDTLGDHGTSVAGLIAMANNNVGGIGVAPRARLKGFNLLSSTQRVQQIIDSLGASGASPNSSDVAVFNQSFGITTNTPVPVQ